MSRITKTIAEQVAKKLLSAKREQEKEIQQQLFDFVEAEYLKKIPENVLKTFEKNPEYISSTKYLTLRENGWNYERVTMSRNLPAKNGSGYLTLASEESDKARKMYNQHLDAVTKNDSLELEITQTLISLSTYKRVEENFPEAFAVLPAAKSTALTVNLAGLRQKLK